MASQTASNPGRRRWRRLWSDLYRIRRPLGIATLLLLVGLGIGYVLHDPSAGSSAADGGSLYDFEDPTAFDIAANNLAVMVLLVGGCLTLGALTVSGLVYNGFVLGTVVKSLVASGEPLWAVVALILPHAVAELTGLLLAAAVSLGIVRDLLLYLVTARDDAVTASELWSAGRLALAATVLVLAGALVEVHATPALA